MKKKTFARTTEGLRDALMAEMEDIRAGIAAAAEAQAFAALAGRAIDSFALDLQNQERIDLLERHKRDREDRAHELAYRRQARLTDESYDAA